MVPIIIKPKHTIIFCSIMKDRWQQLFRTEIVLQNGIFMTFVSLISYCEYSIHPPLIHRKTAMEQL